MDDLTKSIGKLLFECGVAYERLGDPGNLSPLCEEIAGRLHHLAGRSNAEQAALLLLAAGGKLWGEAAELTAGCEQWLDAEKRAMQLLGVVPLAKAE